jgi:hypothetical protein
VMRFSGTPSLKVTPTLACRSSSRAKHSK